MNIAHPFRGFLRASCLALLALPALLAAQTAPASSTAPAKDDEVIKLDPFEALADKGTRGYGTTNAMGATRINTAIGDTPQAIVSLNPEFISNLNPSQLADALRYVSGVSVTSGEYGGSVSIRGLSGTALGFRDGLPDSVAPTSGTGIAVSPDPIEDERLEVIKGPAGVMYGSTGFGGVINRVSKFPLDTRRTEIGFGYTSYDDSEGFYRATVDATGPLDAEKKWSYRVLSAFQDGTNHTHARNGRATQIGTLQFRPDSGTTLWLRYHYEEERASVQQDLWTDSKLNMPFGYLPRNAFVGDYYNNDQTDYANTKAVEFGAKKSFEVLGTSWEARFIARYDDLVGQHRTYISSGNIFYKNGAPLVVNGVTLTSSNTTWVAAAAAGYDDIRENIQRRDLRNGAEFDNSVSFDLTGKLNLGPTHHQILLYGGETKNEYGIHRFRQAWTAAFPSVFHKTEIDPNLVLSPVIQTLAGEWTDTTTKLYNFAAQDSISMFNNRLIGLAAARYDNGDTTAFDHVANTALADVKQKHWTPTYGLVGKPVPGLPGVSLFAVHSETFQPQGGVNQVGERLKPLIGTNNEGGVKLDLYQHRVVLTASHFDMKQENAGLKVINPDGSFFFRQIPSTSTKGYEADLSVQPIDALTLLVAYQWIDARTSSGLQVADVPQRSTYKAVGKYSFLSGPLKNAEFGLTYEVINDSRAGDANNTYFEPGYALTGLFGIYRWHDWRFQVNVNNLSNEWYIAGSTSQQFMRSGAPRAIKTSLNYAF